MKQLFLIISFFAALNSFAQKHPKRVKVCDINWVLQPEILRDKFFLSDTLLFLNGNTLNDLAYPLLYLAKEKKGWPKIFDIEFTVWPDTLTIGVELPQSHESLIGIWHYDRQSYQLSFDLRESICGVGGDNPANWPSTKVTDYEILELNKEQLVLKRKTNPTTSHEK